MENKPKNHRCPYRKINFHKDTLDNINSYISNIEKENKTYINIINDLRTKNKKYHDFIMKLVYDLEPFKELKKTIDYKELINGSTLDQLTKDQYISMFKLYSDFIDAKNKEIILRHKDQDTKPKLLALYDLKNVQLYLNDYTDNSETTKAAKKCKLRNIIRLCTGNAAIDYENTLGKRVPKGKPKHIITDDELDEFTKYVKSKGLFISLIIVEILSKFGFRIGALARFKVSDIGSEGICVFKEKNEQIVKKQLLKETLEKIKHIIIHQKLSDKDYVFFHNAFPNDEKKRAKFLSNKITCLMQESKAFHVGEKETLSSHCFRATLAVKKYKEAGIKMAKEALGHQHESTTINNYLRIEDHNLEINEEENYKNDLKLKKIFNINCRTTVDNNSEDYINDSESSYSIDKNETKKSLKEDSQETNLIEKNILENYSARANPNNKKKAEISEEILLSVNNDITDELDEKKKIENIKKCLKDAKRKFADNIDCCTNKAQSSKFCPYENKLTRLSVVSEFSFERTIEQNNKGIFPGIELYTFSGKSYIRATKRILKDTIIFYVSGDLIFRREFEKLKFDKSDNYIKGIVLYKTKNKSGDRIINISKNSNITCFLIVTSIELMINCKIKTIVNRHNKCYAVIVSTKDIEKYKYLKVSNDNLIL